MEDEEAIILFSMCAVYSLAVLRKRMRSKVVRRYWVRPWIRRRDDTQHQNTMLKLYKELLVDGDMRELTKTLRMPPALYNQLLNLLRPGLQKKHTNFRAPISPLQRLSINMRHLSLGEGFLSLSQQFRVGLSTVRQIIRETCDCIITNMQDDYLKTPSTKKEWLAIAQGFEEKWNFPHVLGAIDGKHIRIVAPPKSGSYYFNYKEYNSIILLAIANAEYEFIFVDIGAEGKASDGGVWQKCTFRHMLEEDGNPLGIPQPTNIPGIDGRLPFFLVSDDAFKLGPNIQKPYPGVSVPNRQRIFNYRLSRCRRIIENSFGILSSRFCLLRRALEVHPDTGQKIVMAYCILHNFLKRNSSGSYMNAASVDNEDDNGHVMAGTWRDEDQLPSIQPINQRNASEYAKSTRNTLAEYFVSKHGEVAWQYEQAFK